MDHEDPSAYKWRRINCIGGPMQFMTVKWPVRDGEEIPIPEETGGGLAGTYTLRDGVYEWRRAER